MSKRVQRSQDVPTFRHTFAPDPEDGHVDWVELKANFRIGDRDAINARMVSPEQKLNKETGEMEYTGGVKVDTSLANVATLLQAITAWGGEGFKTNGKLDPIDMDTVAGLSEDDATALVNAINARNPKAVGPKAPADSETTATSTSAS